MGEVHTSASIAQHLTATFTAVMVAVLSVLTGRKELKLQLRWQLSVTY